MYNTFGRRPNMGVGTVLGTNNEDFENCITTVLDLVNIANAWLTNLKVIYITECGFDSFDKDCTWAKFLWVLEWVKKNVSGLKSDEVEALEMIKNTDVYQINYLFMLVFKLHRLHVVGFLINN